MKFFVPDDRETRENDGALYELVWKAQRHGHQGTEDPLIADFWLIQTADDRHPSTSLVASANPAEADYGAAPAFVFEPRTEGYIYWTHNVGDLGAVVEGAVEDSADLGDYFLDFLTDVLDSREGSESA